MAVHRGEEIVEFGVARGDIDLVAALQVHAFSVAVAEGAHAVPFPFEGVVIQVMRQVIGHGEHRLNARGERVGFSPPHWRTNRYRTRACHEASWLRPP